MRKFTLLFFVLSAILMACSEDDQPGLQEKEKVQFALDLLGEEHSGGRVASDIPHGAVASVEIQGPHGTITESIEILSFGDSYVTAPLELPTGSHKLLSFMIVGEGNQVLFAAPKDGSPLAGAVDNALPNTFVVQKGKIRNFPVQVIDVSGKLPEHFGYASFGIEVVTPLAVTVFIEENGELTMTGASAYLQPTNSSDTTQYFALGAKVNYISFEGETAEPYLIRVEKPGFQTEFREFVYDELGENHSLTFVLVKEQPDTLRIDAQAHELDVPFVMLMRIGMNEPGSVTVAWGDGTVETKEFSASALEKTVSHTYGGGQLSASFAITGDLGKIVKFSCNNCRYSNLGSLPNLEYFADARSDFNPIQVDSLDLSENSRLTYVGLDEPDFLLKLGDGKTELKQFFIRGQYKLNQLVPELQRHIVSNNLHDGMIEFFHGPPPTEEQRAILRSLREEYGWYIAFDYEAI